MDSTNERRSTRFPDIGKVTAPELCMLPGVLDNISREGCKIHFPIPVVVDLDNDYELRIHPVRNLLEGELALLGHPQWVKEDKGSTEIGFQILPSTDFTRFQEYVKKLNSDDDSQSIDSQIVGSVCRFV